MLNSVSIMMPDLDLALIYGFGVVIKSTNQQQQSWTDVLAMYRYIIIIIFHSKLLVDLFFSRYIIFIMHLDIHYVWIHDENNVSKKDKLSYNLEPRSTPSLLFLFLFYIWLGPRFINRSTR
jgi:hypothetical protein